jgi:hypothetical protein
MLSVPPLRGASDVRRPAIRYKKSLNSNDIDR